MIQTLKAFVQVIVESLATPSTPQDVIDRDIF
jgi:hypothetical protein